MHYWKTGVAVMAMCWTLRSKSGFKTPSWSVGFLRSDYCHYYMSFRDLRIWNINTNLTLIISLNSQIKCVYKHRSLRLFRILFVNKKATFMLTLLRLYIINQFLINVRFVHPAVGREWQSEGFKNKINLNCKVVKYIFHSQGS